MSISDSPSSFSSSFKSSSPGEEEEDKEEDFFNTRSNNESCVATLTPTPFARPQMHACIDDDDLRDVLWYSSPFFCASSCVFVTYGTAAICEFFLSSVFCVFCVSLSFYSLYYYKLLQQL